MVLYFIFFCLFFKVSAKIHEKNEKKSFLFVTSQPKDKIIPKKNE